MHGNRNECRNLVSEYSIADSREGDIVNRMMSARYVNSQICNLQVSLFFYFFINVHKAPAHAHQIFAFIVTYKFSPAHVSYGVVGIQQTTETNDKNFQLT